MATITAQNIIDKAEIILQDTTNTRWPAAELLGWLNDAQRKIVSFKPDANPTNESVALAIGTKQTLPATGSQLIKVVRNMGVDGATPGNVVRDIKQEILDDQNPDWHSEVGGASIDHYVFDERDPKTWYCYPPSDGTTKVEIVYAAIPADILITDTITLDDSYSDAILDYILYRAYLKDKDYAGNGQRSVNSYNAFKMSLGMKEKMEISYSPNIPEQARAQLAAIG